LAKGLGAGKEVAAEIAAANTARHAMELAQAARVTGLADAVAERAARHATRFAGGRVKVAVVLTDFDGNVLGRSPE
jgi:cobalt-precorrin-5B (C1)-methyltransferase